MTAKKYPITRNDDQVIQELKDEVLIYDLKTNKAYCLNETSALVWQACDGSKSVSEISSQLSKKLKQAVSEDLVWLALDDLKKNNLLSGSETIPTKFDGMSRREIIRKAGLASMIALPLVSSLVAPTAASAQSGCGSLTQACCNGTTCNTGSCVANRCCLNTNFAACTSDAQCCSGVCCEGNCIIGDCSGTG